MMSDKIWDELTKQVTEVCLGQEHPILERMYQFPQRVQDVKVQVAGVHHQSLKAFRSFDVHFVSEHFAMRVCS